MHALAVAPRYQRTLRTRDSGSGSMNVRNGSSLNARASISAAAGTSAGCNSAIEGELIVDLLTASFRPHILRHSSRGAPGQCWPDPAPPKHQMFTPYVLGCRVRGG